MDTRILKSVKTYTDYREFLHAHYRDRKAGSRAFSYRFIAKRLGVDHTHVVRIFNGRAHLSDKLIGPFAGLCRMDPEEEAWFRTLVRFNKAKDDGESAALIALLSARLVTEPSFSADDKEGSTEIASRDGYAARVAGMPR